MAIDYREDGHPVDKPSGPVLIEIPADGNYIEILGHKINGFESFEEFMKYLDGVARTEIENKKLKDNWDNLRRYLADYRYEHSKDYPCEGADGRYCVAISCTDLLKKMNEIEEGN